VGSGGTIRGIDDRSSIRPIDQTPSYPFPRVKNQIQADVESPARQGQFRLKLPSEKLKSPSPTTHSATEEPSAETPASAPVFLPPDHKELFEDSAFATPSLYDLTLQLNADPGLEAWWSHLAEILETHYGAERISLAVPGDSTDLENVPWGQKAFFNRNGSTSSENIQIALQDNTSAETQGSCHKSDQTREHRSGISEPQLRSSKPISAATRPSLMSRHSFGGFAQGKKISPTSYLDDQQHVSKLNLGKSEKKHARISDKIETSQSSSTHARFMTQPKPVERPNLSVHGLRQGVFPVSRALEMEADPLIKRTGVVRLFGRTNPVVLTREYSPESIYASHMASESALSPLETVQVTPYADGSCEIDPIAARVSVKQAPLNLNPPRFGHYDEYEQVPQSPWSQSPAPSPAPRTHADQNPFFTNHAVDEGAFSKNPPAHDYSSSHPLEAIGIDQSKTLIHIPLLHGSSSNRKSSPTLRFPVAVVSFMTPIVPYPPNLRQSLAHLMPHLTASFCLAQHYSQLERQVVSKLETTRYGNLLGLGGTFSDASSELELVAGLSGHVSYSVGDENSVSARDSIASPSDRSSMKFSPAISSIGTPGFELGQMGLGSAIQSPGFFSRTGETGDSYFNVSQPKSTRDSINSQRPRFTKHKSNLASAAPESPERLHGKPSTVEESHPQEPLIVPSPIQETRPPLVVSPTQQSSRQASTNSYYAQLHRDSPRPFSDTITQLMLNSIPLHLFLAKPQSGEVIWTNAKFDAYRRSKPHEQKLRDPWQNIHSSERDHVAGEWANALRTGSQFTERVRVKRFNDESAYRWFIFRANPLLSSTGEVLYWIGSFLDIHEQHTAELKATQEREKFATDAKYRAFSNSIPQVVFEATENRGLIFVNEQWNLYTGQSLDEALNLGFARHVHPEDLDKCGGLSLQTQQESDGSGTTGSPQQSSKTHGVESALHELVARGVASSQKDENGRVFYSTEIRLSSKGGDFRWHLVRLVRVETSSFGSEESSWYGTCTDINDRKNLERELNKAMSQLNNQMESKTKFFSNMSHEIRTPLNGILGTLPFILDTQLDSDQRRMLDTIQNSSTGLRELVDNILDVSRVEAGKMSMVNSWFHVRSMIEEVIDTIYSKAIDKNLEVNYLIDPDVPMLVIGDRFRIRQVLLNLAGNAVKFTSQGEVHICCNLYHQSAAKAKDTEVFLNFDVVDTGKGFSSVDAKRLMQRFSQLGENGSQQNAGSGLGLFLSKQLVEMHGGKLTPSSKEGQGAKFSFNVKVDAPTPPSPSERPGLLRQPSNASRRPGVSRLNSHEQNTAVSPRISDLKLQDLPNLSPGVDSPNASPDISATSVSKALFPSSNVSSALPTPDIATMHLASTGLDQAPNLNASSLSAHLPPSASQSSLSPTKGTGRPSVVTPQSPLSIVIICPLDNTRDAAKQHIEHVIPHEVSFAISALPDVDEWKDMMQSGSNTRCTHLVLILPVADDIMEVIQQVSELDKENAPAIIIISDPYQKRQVAPRVSEFAATGRQVFIVNKPVKPSAFSAIFDPEKKRELSKDRRDDETRDDNNNFKTVSKMVKEVLGNKGYRILLVEDDETNRNVRPHFSCPCPLLILTNHLR
jgi:signal transduction histidine kinase